MVDHDFSFRGDWQPIQRAPLAVIGYENGRPILSPHTKTGHVANHYSIGPAILWAPFLLPTHIVVLAAHHLGYPVEPDGHSSPYLYVMALATALYGCAAVLLSFRLARQFTDEFCAILATLGIWLGTSLPVYMYVEPAWSHAHSAFTTALVLWYWNRTRGSAEWKRWLIIGAFCGLLLDVYYVNAIFLLPLALEIVAAVYKGLVDSNHVLVNCWLRDAAVWVSATFIAFLPTLIVKKVLYGSVFNLGYTEHWYLNSPAFWNVCFAAQHGLFVWAPILVPAFVGLYFLRRKDPVLVLSLAAVSVIFLYAIGCYEKWDGVKSYGNRFFVSLTPIFVLGLAASFSQFLLAWNNPRGAKRRIVVFTVLAITWNLGLVYQWSAGLLPDVGPIYWKEVFYNQFRVVPAQLTQGLLEGLHWML
jgi:hypothetical protein